MGDGGEEVGVGVGGAAWVAPLPGVAGSGYGWGSLWPVGLGEGIASLLTGLGHSTLGGLVAVGKIRKVAVGADVASGLAWQPNKTPVSSAASVSHPIFFTIARNCKEREADCQPTIIW